MKAPVLLGVLLATAVAAGPLLEGDARVAWPLVVGGVAACAIVVAARVHRLTNRRTWHLLGASLLVSGAGGALALAQPAWDPAARATSAVWALGMIAVAGALLGLQRRRSQVRDVATLLDAGVVVTGVAAAGWLVLGQPFLEETALSARAQAAVVAVAALSLLAVSSRLLIDVGVRQLPGAAIGGGVAAFVGVALLDASAALGADPPLLLSPLLVAVASALLAFAAVHPASEGLSAPPITVESGLRGGRIVTLGLASAVTAATMVVHAAWSAGGAIVAAVAAGLVLLGLLAARTAWIVGGYERFVDREHVLRECAAALVAAESREEIATAVTDAAMELAGGPRHALVETTFGPRPDLSRVANAVVAGSGPVVEAVRGELRLNSGLGRLGSAHTIVAPMVVGERLAGLLRVTGRRPLPAHLAESVQTLVAQTVLALESVDHAEIRVAKESEARFRSLIQNSNDVIAIVDPALTVRYVTPSVGAMLGREVADVVGSELASLLHPAEVEDVTGVFAAVAESGEAAVHEFRLKHGSGRWRRVEGVVGNMLEDFSVRGLVLTAHDVTERRALEDQLAHQAFHDALSGLPNRALFGNRVDHAIERAVRSGTDLAVLFVDLDDFKTVNDSLGHGVGDDLLVAVARRLAGCLRAADTAARLGGDEFAMLLEDVNGVDGAVAVANRLLEALGQPLVLGRTQLYVRASIGIVLGQAGQTTEEMLRNADVAMYRAKGRGGNRFEVFEPAMHEAAVTRLQLKADLERSFNGGELHVEYQPIVSLATGEVDSIEALLRWRHPERGPISPLEFIPLAEETGLILEIGDWVLRQAAIDALSWQQLLPPERRLGINVNISGRQLQSHGFVERVGSVLSETGVDPGDVILEITESTLMDEVSLVIARLAEVRRLGVRIAVDDFGTGFSSLGYLQRFPVDILKIAKPFVDELGGSDRPARLVQAVIGLAHSLDLDTIAEGIETDAQRRQLVELGCSLGQGYLFARPQRADDIRPLLRASLAA